MGWCTTIISVLIFSEPDISGCLSNAEINDIVSDQSSESEPEGNEEEFDSDSEEWNEDDCVENDMIDESDPEDEISLANVSITTSVLARWLVQFLLHLQCVYRLSNAALSSIFCLITTFLCVLGQFSELCNDLARAFPRSLYITKQNSMIN